MFPRWSLGSISDSIFSWAVPLRVGWYPMPYVPHQRILTLNHHVPSPSPPPAPVPLSKAARDQRAALNRSAGLVPAAPKSKSTSRKRQQSNADESANKCNKTETTDLDDTTMDAAIDAEEKNEGKKGGKKGKKAKKTGGQGKNMYLFFYLFIYLLFNYIYHF